MPRFTDDAIALRQWEYSETSQTLALFTREHGIVRAMAKGSKREKSSFSGGIEVLTHGTAVAIVKQTTDLATLTAWDLRTIFWRTRNELAAHRAGLYLVDLVYHAITDHDPHPGLYDALIGSLQALEDGEETHAVVARFQWALLLEVGSQPDLELVGSPSGSVPFDPVQGRCIAETSGGSWPVLTETIERIRAYDREEKPSTGDDTRAGRFLSEYLAHVIGRDLASRRAIFGPSVTRNGTRFVKEARPGGH